MNDVVGGESVRVSYALSGIALIPDEISRLAGVSPDVAARAGDPVVTGGAIRRRKGIWQINATAEAPHDSDAALATLLDRLGGPSPLFVELGTRFDASITISVETREGQIGVSLPRAVVRAAASLNARMEIGVLVLGE